MPDIAQSGIPFSINLDGFSGPPLLDGIADIAIVAVPHMFIGVN